jgi:hypothetical protein
MPTCSAQNLSAEFSMQNKELHVELAFVTLALAQSCLPQATVGFYCWRTHRPCRD